MSKVMSAEALEQQPAETFVSSIKVMCIKHGLQARKVGMFITRGATTKYLLTDLSRITGVKYKANDIEKGIQHCERLLTLIKNAQDQGQNSLDLTGKL